ncbi:YegS/Rv2252/BmrU family lipid kinase [Parvibaculum sp.]|jgi:diacylglycerol kinase (ATP)|uniref:YegS/Rv2252/BmrU family lipid kinase n=1 Tax=Parvibaculum sp. TaxID=2024848 RepID=UPI001AFE51CF|nr:YegS/Rv2252/BmrU family lipid kinase [Parvibaculum sp.]MBO6633203.1 YegS/Rv2252/BmrU family lipid kinase [Parvibaculum sp.]MBO6677114.1 YegS/Rv2252/BmrU family lipid kinase [Parvibaculum sp.]MBO6683926.1 YegS/Rv2252/BmrU family lipid kinase [Parvibaculum sp.]MBO6904300.1 YegS/Rv2252/BmrU family lipid kinase [Parvibaculum sp.]
MASIETAAPGADAESSAETGIRRLLLVENPNSGGGDHWDTEVFLEAARVQGIEVRHERPDNPDACCELLNEAENVDAVAVAGGDGTLNPLVQCLVERRLPLLVLPAGTANDFARSLQMPEKPDELAALLHDGRISAVDVGYANDKPFLNAASIGMTNTISRLQSKERKRQWGVLSYAVSAFEAGRTARSFRAHFEGGGKPRDMRCIQLLVGNGRFYGGGMTVHADATLTDGLLHLYAAVPRSLFGMAALLPFLRFGRTDLAPEVLCDEGAEISIATVPRRHVFADGEELTETPVRFRVARRALMVILPKENGK